MVFVENDKTFKIDTDMKVNSFVEQILFAKERDTKKVYL